MASSLAAAPSDLHWLGAEEAGRLGRMGHPGRRRQFLAAHWRARELLAACCGGMPGDWTLARTADGAPCALREGIAGDGYLSIAHSGDQVACAVAPLPVGIDLEVSPRARSLQGLIETLYDADTRLAWAALTPEALRRVFYQRWTLDEALAKVDGTGLRAQQLRQWHWQPVPGGVPARAWSWLGPSCWLALALGHEGNAPVPEGDVSALQHAATAWQRVPVAAVALPVPCPEPPAQEAHEPDCPRDAATAFAALRCR